LSPASSWRDEATANLDYGMGDAFMDYQIVIFELASELFGLQIAAVESIIKLQPITRVPHTPGFVEGVTNLRGNVLPVIDLRKRFGLAPKTVDKNSRIIVVNVDKIKVGMIVDAVKEVLTVSEEAVEPAPAIAMTVDSNFITGIVKISMNLVILLNLARVLAGQAAENRS
jgi:purine-binding chemotaxis protein CheW